MYIFFFIAVLFSFDVLAQQPPLVDSELIATRQQRDAAHNQVAALAALLDKLNKELEAAKKNTENCKPKGDKK